MEVLVHGLPHLLLVMLAEEVAVALEELVVTVRL
jgi:hypothetical protein